jgi:hypothetical protein
LKPIIEDEEEWKIRKIERVEMSFEFLKKKRVCVEDVDEV